ncbi:uncharacterized protein LOC134775825 [Penaeus indicus]|uniref:uncharacterized protein LOC134775825 n=1 Tax=Penaeus indicus TaxID=29960 RepID=UPI00300D50EA
MTSSTEISLSEYDLPLDFSPFRIPFSKDSSSKKIILLCMLSFGTAFRTSPKPHQNLTKFSKFTAFERPNASYPCRRSRITPFPDIKAGCSSSPRQCAIISPTVNMKVFAAVLCLAAAASARMAYQLPDGFLDILGGDPQQAFSCDNRAYGYYADVANGCRIFHVCEPIADELGELVETAHYSFVCGNQTVFSQESLTCAHPEEAFPCDQAETLYDLSNADFGKIPVDI